MRVISPPINGPVVGETIIYVDSPEVRKKYEERIAMVAQDLRTEINEKNRQLQGLKDELGRNDFQIKNYVQLIEKHSLEHADLKNRHQNLLSRPDPNPALSGQLSVLKSTLKTKTEEYLSVCEKHDVEMREIDILVEQNEALIRRMTQELNETKAALAVQSIEPEYFLEEPKINFAYYLTHYFSWPEALGFVALMLAIFFAGLLAGGYHHG